MRWPTAPGAPAPSGAGFASPPRRSGRRRPAARMVAATRGATHRWTMAGWSGARFREGPALGTDAAGAYPAGASPFGVLDMAGNAWDWCLDVFEETYYQRAPALDLGGPLALSESGVFRGGSWISRGRRCTAAVATPTASSGPAPGSASARCYPWAAVTASGCCCGGWPAARPTSWPRSGAGGRTCAEALAGDHRRDQPGSRSSGVGQLASAWPSSHSGVPSPSQLEVFEAKWCCCVWL